LKGQVFPGRDAPVLKGSARARTLISSQDQPAIAFAVLRIKLQLLPATCSQSQYGHSPKCVLTLRVSKQDNAGLLESLPASVESIYQRLGFVLIRSSDRSVYMKRHSFLAVFFFALAALLSASIPAQTPPIPRVPKGIYIRTVLDSTSNQAEAAAYPGGVPAYPNAAADAILVKYFYTLLENPAVAGLALAAPWGPLNPNDPGPDPFHPAAGAYVWNSLDDAFIAVDRWNRSHAWLAPKTIQMIPTPGFNAPGWVFTDIDASVCGDHKDCTGAGSCDSLFESSPAKPASHECGYTTLFFRTEGDPIVQMPLPLPWNSVYKNIWRNFLIALNHRIQQEPASSAFVSIEIGGPTSSSTEMILPNQENQSFGGNHGILTLPNNVPTIANLDSSGGWNKLIDNYYGTSSGFANSDEPFIQEWDNAIDEYGQVFNGVMLSLTTATDTLPDFVDWDPTKLISSPAPGFASDCGITNATPIVQNNQQQCAAVTWVLAHFVDPFVGGNNTKTTQENGLTAAKDSPDVSTSGIKWLALKTYGGSTPPWDSRHSTSRILGGLQFGKTLSQPSDLQVEGCPTFPQTNCAGLTPAQGLENVFQDSLFVGTPAGSFYDAAPPVWDDAASSPDCVNFGNFNFCGAPLNFLQIYDNDVLYASGLSGCTMLQITGNPDEYIPPTCVPSITADVAAMQAELNLGSEKLISISEWVRLW
jgi:hypothetical protein